MRKPAVFVDRDGVILENRADYVKSWEEVRFLPRVLPALARLHAAGLPTVMVTNQSLAGRGLLSLDAVLDIQRMVVAEIARHGGRIDHWCLCPHAPHEDCACRKPRPGGFRQAAAELDLDLARSWMVGDNVIDVEAAVNAGVQPMMVLTGMGLELAFSEAARRFPPFRVFADLAAAVEFILGEKVKW